MKRVHLVINDEQHQIWWEQKKELKMTWEEFFVYATGFIPTITMSDEND